MSNRGVDPLILKAWLAARSVARGLPAPVPDHGGFRVDTGSAVEVARWVFPASGSGLATLARSIDQPGRLLKLCGPAEALRSVLPDGWTLHPPGYFMQATGAYAARRLDAAYRVETSQVGPIIEARIIDPAGALAASGHAVELGGVFIYDQIATEPGQRRKGLGHAVMATLRSARRDTGSLEVLVATEAGRALYTALGWTTISPYSTASIMPSRP